MDSLPEDAGGGPAAVLSWFRREFHTCLTARKDDIFELADAVLCADGPVRDLAGLSLAPEHRRGHGALYDAVNHGRVDIGRLRRPREEPGADDPGLALLGHRGAGAGPHLLDRGAGRYPAGPRGRRDRGHRGP